MPIALFSLINYIGGQENLYCSHETVNHSLKQPTKYSQLSGMMYNDAIIAIYLCIPTLLKTFMLLKEFSTEPLNIFLMIMTQLTKLNSLSLTCFH